MLFVLPVSAGAQTPGDSASPVIQAVAIRRNDVFDSTEAHNWLTRLANRLHITTRESVVRREVLLHPGQAYDSAAAAETARNLRALGIFRRVVVDTVRGDSGLMLRVETSDGWSTRPDYRFKSTGGQADYTIAFIEDNVLGTATQASIRYRHSADRTSTSFGFLQPRFIWPQLRLETIFQDRSDGRRFAALVGKPFYSQASRNSLLFLFDDRNERVLRFLEGERVARDSLRRDYQLLRVEGGIALGASDRGYLRGGLTAQARKDRYRRESASSFSTPSEATYALGPFLEWRRSRYALTRSYQGFGREEDVDVSTLVRIGVLAAPRAFNYERDGLAPLVQA
jgi:outer membrane protein assembly factor BamA